MLQAFLKFAGPVQAVLGLGGAAGVNQVAGISLSQGNVAMAINFIVGLWGLAAGFMKQK